MDALISSIIPIDPANDNASVVNMCRCNFMCPYCNALEHLSSVNGKMTSCASVIDNVVTAGTKKVIFGGGEPMIQPQALKEMCKLCKDNGIMVYLETNGYNHTLIGELMTERLINYAYVSIKAPLNNPRIYSRMSGIIADEKLLLHIGQSAQLARGMGAMVEIRMPIVPGYTDTPRQVDQLSRQIAPYCDVFTLEQFMPDYGTLDPTFSSIESPSLQKLKRLSEVAKHYIADVRIKTAMYGTEGV